MTTFKVRGWSGIAFFHAGAEMETDYDGFTTPTGRVKMIMVGDDRVHIVDKDDIEPIPEDAYCSECGQIGCTADGRER